MNRKVATTLTTLPHPPSRSRRVAVAPAANAQSAPQERTTIAFSARTDRILDGSAREDVADRQRPLTVKASQPSALGLQVLRKARTVLSPAAESGSSSADANLVFGHWGFNTTNRNVNAVINKNARATFFKLKARRPARRHVQGGLQQHRRRQLQHHPRHQSFHAGDTFGRPPLI